jgi:hypothetical protein
MPSSVAVDHTCCRLDVMLYLNADAYITPTLTPTTNADIHADANADH